MHIVAILVHIVAVLVHIVAVLVHIVAVLVHIVAVLVHIVAVLVHIVAVLVHIVAVLVQSPCSAFCTRSFLHMICRQWWLSFSPESSFCRLPTGMLSAHNVWQYVNFIRFVAAFLSLYIYIFGRCDPTRVMASSFLRFSRSHTTTHHSR